MESGWWPGDYPISQPYGCTDFALEGHSPYHPECAYFHDGLDIAIPCGVPVVSQVVGRVRQRGLFGGGPNALIIETGDWFIWLLHLETALVGVGDAVAPGMVVGNVGTLGFSTGCHLHFEVNRTANNYRASVDPGPWLVGSGVPQRGCAVAVAAALAIAVLGVAFR